tara:strand:- start:1858 stop:2937 length:1080 start_codon:yes stop_codon:yes gene_type:complete
MEPEISIILPIRNEVAFIERTLNSILNQSYPINKFEIIISDGMSDDGTRRIIKNYQSRYSNIFLIDNPKYIVPTGFNLALNRARGKIIIRVDGHTIIDKNYIYSCKKALKDSEASNVGGLMNAKSDTILGQVIAIATSSKFGIGNAHFHYSQKSRYVDTVYMGAWKREVFCDIGGFDEDLIRNQDDEFNFRLIQNGKKIWLDRSIKSTYYPRNSFYNLFKQYFQYGFYKLRVMQKRNGIASLRHLVPPGFVFGIFFCVFLYLYGLSKIPLQIYLGAYFLSNSLSVLFIIIKKIKLKSMNIKLFLALLVQLPIVYFILHFSYGLGFCFAFFYFYDKWNDNSTRDDHFSKSDFEISFHKIV